MDLGILGALLMLVVWAVLTMFFGAPAWSNALLTLGVFLLILRVVMRGTRGVGGVRSTGGGPAGGRSTTGGSRGTATRGRR